MTSSTNTSPYEEVVRVTHVYLGPAADRFIDRQVQSHLRKQPQRLTKTDLSNLIDWIRIAMSLLTDDQEIVDEYIAQLQKIAAAKSAVQKRTKAKHA